MALSLSFNACTIDGCSKLSFNETTGLYDVSLNTGGWGAPNLTIGAVTETHIKITLPDGSTIVDILNPTGLPTSNPNLSYEISFDTLNSIWTKIQDGLYQIEYTVTDGITTYTTTPLWFLFTCNIECCISKMFAKIATSIDCSCDDINVKNALYADSLLQGLKALRDSGNISGINSLLTKLNNICNFTSEDCGCNK